MSRENVVSSGQLRASVCRWWVPLALLLAATSLPAAEPSGDASVVEKTPGLVAFWTFGEKAGEPRLSQGTKNPHPLQEVNGPIPRVEGGPYSGYAAEFDGKRYFRIPYAETKDLDISGPKAQVSMFAVVRIVDLRQSRTIAGMWSEGKGRNDDTGTRQYAMLMNMPTYGGPNQLVPHISSEGGVTRRADGSAFPWCCDYAASVSKVPEETWCTLTFTYDGEYIRAYVNGKFEPRKLDPKQDRRDDPYFTKEGPGGGDRGMNPYYHGRGIFAYDPEKHAKSKPDGGADFTVGARYAVGSFLREATKGRFGGLAVFDRALTDDEVAKLHASAGIDALNDPQPRIGTAILGAFDDEVALLEKRLENAETRKHLGVPFRVGTLAGRKVVIARTGVGKVNAAMTTTLLVEHFRPRRVIFTGVAGSLNPDLGPGDLLLATHTVQHDRGTVDGEQLKLGGFIGPVTEERDPVRFPADESLLATARRAAKSLELERVEGAEHEPRVREGIVATGDVFVMSVPGKQAVKKRTEADAVEMEGAAVAQVCRQLGVPLLVIRSISDNADENASRDFAKFAPVAARNSIRLVLAILAEADAGTSEP